LASASLPDSLRAAFENADKIEFEAVDKNQTVDGRQRVFVNLSPHINLIDVPMMQSAS
jgi:hypothetical protein